MFGKMSQFNNNTVRMTQNIPAKGFPLVGFAACMPFLLFITVLFLAANITKNPITHVA